MDIISYALGKKRMQQSVSEYLDEHLTNPTNPPIDTSLTIAGAAADSKETGSRITALKEGLHDLDGEVVKTVNGIAPTSGNVNVTADADAVTDAQSMTDMTDTDKLYRYNGSIYYYNGTEWTEVGSGREGGDISDLENLVNSMNNYGTVSEDVDLSGDFVSGRVYNTGGAVGGKATLNPSSNSNYRGAYWAVNEGDQFTFTGRGGDSNVSRPYCFTDNDLNVLVIADKNVTLTDFSINAPADGYLISGFKVGSPSSVIKRVESIITLHDKMDEVDGDIAEVDAKFDSIPKWMASNILAGNPLWNETERTATGTGSADFIEPISANISNNSYSLDGDVIYLSVMVKASGSPTKFSISHGSSNLSIISTVQNLPTADTWYRLSSIDRQVSVSVPDYRYVGVRAYYADSTAQNGQVLTYKCGLAFNLTAIFGKGNEPTDPAVIDAMLSQYENGWFSGSQDIWNPSIIKWLAESYKSFVNGTYYGSDGKRFTAGSIIDRYDSQWDHAQTEYGISKTLVPVDNKFEGGIRTNGMVNVFPKYGRWEYGAHGTNSGSLFGGHVFEAWNNIRSYRLTMMMGHGGDEVSYTDENNVVHKTPREDEACIIVYSPANSYANPPVTPTEEQSKLRINKAQEDYYGENAQNMLGRVRIGGDTPTQGTVFTKDKMITYGRMINADISQENKGKQLVFNSDGTVTWREVDLYQHPEPAPTE